MKGIFVLLAILALANCSTFLRNLACTGAQADIADDAACKECNGEWSESTTPKCSCTGGKTFTVGTGCVDPTPDPPTPTPTASCTIETADAIKTVTNGTLCTDCGFKWDSSASDSKKCTCPTEDTDFEKINGKTACVTVCGYKWNETAEACSGMYIKIASALFALLFLL